MWRCKAVPIYEYQCTKCGEVFEAFQKVTDKPLNKCKFCQGKVEKLISQSSFQLKGSGWYLTDYARKSQTGSGTDKSASKPEEKTAKPASESSSKKSDSSKASNS
jgi:putative FmdB family regulatory protein